MGQVRRLTFHPNGAQFANQIDAYRISIWDVKKLFRLKTLYGWEQNYTQATSPQPVKCLFGNRLNFKGQIVSD